MTMSRRTKELISLNKYVAGTGYQFFKTPAQVRVENEDGVFLFYSRSIRAALKRTIPFGCGGTGINNFERLVKLGGGR
jgi:hypothetical protein